MMVQHWMLACFFGSFVIFQGIRTSIAKLWFFRWGVLTPFPPLWIRPWPSLNYCAIFLNKLIFQPHNSTNNMAWSTKGQFQPESYRPHELSATPHTVVPTLSECFYAESSAICSEYPISRGLGAGIYTGRGSLLYQSYGENHNLVWS